MGEQTRLLLDFTPGEVYHANRVTTEAVGSYPAFSPLLASGNYAFTYDTLVKATLLLTSGIFSVALSVTQIMCSRELPGTNVLWSPDFPLN